MASTVLVRGATAERRTQRSEREAGMVDRVQRMRDAYDRLNERNFEDPGNTYAKDVRFHLPGLALDTEGFDKTIAGVREFVERGDVRYEVGDVAEFGPFVVGHVRGQGTFDGETRSWEVLQVARWRDDLVAENWSLRA
jgi:SnoaL-like domain